MKKIIYSIAFVFCTLQSFAQHKAPKIHSHNDYKQTIPFWNALASEANSIEIDVVLQHEKLYVAHEQSSLDMQRTLEAVYLQPLVAASNLGLGNLKDLQLVIEFKSQADKSMEALLAILQPYQHLFQQNNMRIVISGNKPDLAEFVHYPDYIYADYQSNEVVSDPQLWNRVAMVSYDFKTISQWNGKGRIVQAQKQALVDLIEQTHQRAKEIRFWATPDGKTAWKALDDLGVDYINTDKPGMVKTYFEKLPNYQYTNTSFSAPYAPSFASDQKQVPIKNVILLVGDGNGLTQISAAALANKGELSLLQLKSIGFIKTQASDDFTTDSAAAGTALATGQKTFNRSIGMGDDGQELQNITQVLKKRNFNVGIITTDEITGATPAAFYAHQMERDLTEHIAQDLVESPLDLFVGAGQKYFTNTKLSEKFDVLDSYNALANSNSSKVGLFLAHGALKGVIDGRQEDLKWATQASLSFLQAKQKPFFLMIEGAKIDSYGHANNTAGIITEGIDFDKAIAQALAFADKDGHTLVIITADHETGGFSIPQGDVATSRIEGDFITDDHSGVMVPIFAYGPYSHEFTGVYQNSEVYHKILSLLENSQL